MICLTVIETVKTQTLTFIALLLYIGGCGLGSHCDREYLFELPFSVYPINDTLQIGDTLWIEAHFDHGMPDVNSNDVVVLEDISFYSEFNIAKLDSLEIMEGATFFIYHVVEGSYNSINFSGGGIAGQIEYDYNGNAYDFEMGLEIQKEGLFCFSITSVLLNGEHVPSPDIDGDCENERVKTTHLINNGDSVKYHLRQYSPIESVRATTEEEFVNYGMYCFVAVE